MIMKENKEDIAVILNKDNIKTKKNKKEDEYILDSSITLKAENSRV